MTKAQRAILREIEQTSQTRNAWAAHVMQQKGWIAPNATETAWIVTDAGKQAAE